MLLPVETFWPAYVPTAVFWAAALLPLVNVSYPIATLLFVLVIPSKANGPIATFLVPVVFAIKHW